jgi:hypothetical protein
MGWSHKAVVGDREVSVMFNRSGTFRPHLDRGGQPVELFRVGGRHVRLVVQRHGWEQLSDEQKAKRLREWS